MINVIAAWYPINYLCKALIKNCINMDKYYLFSFVNSIPFNNLSHLVVYGYEFHWNGYCWEFVGMFC